MKLYYSPGACSLSPHIALHEAGLSADLEKVDLAKKITASGHDYSQINPKGYVPALEMDDGGVLTEGPAIVQYIADRSGNRELAPPAGSPARYRLQEWLGFIASEIHKGFGSLFDSKVPDEAKVSARDRLIKRLAFTDAALAKQPYLLGSHFSVADGYLYTVLRWCEYVKLDLATWPNLLAFSARVAARPAVRAAMLAEGIAKA